jgi:hypothetical protein
VQATPEGRPLYACSAQQPFTSVAVVMRAAESLATSAHVVSDELWCVRGVTIIGAEHEPLVTGSGKAGAKLPKFNAANTLLGSQLSPSSSRASVRSSGCRPSDG